jgi:hypothetical protein
MNAFSSLNLKWREQQKRPFSVLGIGIMPIVCDFAINPLPAWGLFFRHQKRVFQLGKEQNYRVFMDKSSLLTKEDGNYF